MLDYRFSTISLAVVLSSFNRKDKTLGCIDAVIKQSQTLSHLIKILHIILVDDGSNDGTVEAVATHFPEVEIVLGSGALFWCKSMHIGQAIAARKNCDYLLWLNDDVELDHDAISRALEFKLEHNPYVLVGSLRHPESGTTTYGGMVRRSAWKKTNFSLIDPGVEAKSVTTMNGNFVLIPKDIYQSVGNLDESFEHAMGDLDYGLRVKEAGFDIFVLPAYVGTCTRNSIDGTFMDKSLPLERRWKHMLSPKGLPIRSWLVFTRRHTGVMWPVYWLWPYFRLIVSSLVPSRK